MKSCAEEPRKGTCFFFSSAPERLWFSLFRSSFLPRATAQSFLSVLYCERKTSLHATSKVLPRWSKRIISPANISVLERFRYRFVSWMWSDETRNSIWG